MAASAIFPQTPRKAGMYESFYLRAVAPEEPIGVWIRNTVHKAPGRAPQGSVWCTIFDRARGRPFMHKLTSANLRVPATGWIAIGQDDADPADEQVGDRGAREPDRDGGGELGPDGARGSCGAARWSLSVRSSEPELRHLPRAWLYRAPLPRTKLTSPAPSAIFEGELEVRGDRVLTLAGWRGMVGHNWGSEHAERWIWLHGIGFEQAPEAWLDVALGRVRVAGRTTPWVANGALSLAGQRMRVGGLGARGISVSESAEGCELGLTGPRGLRIHARVEVPPASAAGWRYADPEPGGGGHDVVNCSIASLVLQVTLPDESSRTLSTAHGGAYELGMRERDHGVPLAPFEDG